MRARASSFPFSRPHYIFTPAPLRSAPAEHIPNPYISLHELERKLKEELKERDAKTLEAKAAEVEKLGKKKADGTITEHEARRLAAYTQIVKGEKAAIVAAAERKGFRAGAGSGTASRLSSSVMFHPVNMKNAMAALH